MSTDTVTAGPDGSRDGIATRTATVLDASLIHRDWRHTWAEAAGITTAVTSGGALISATVHGPALLTWALAVGCAPAAAALLVLLTLMAREGRRWTYTTEPDPS